MDTLTVQHWASVKDGKWHRIDQEVTHLNYRQEFTGACGVRFHVLNSSEGYPSGWKNICKHCDKES